MASEAYIALLLFPITNRNIILRPEIYILFSIDKVKIISNDVVFYEIYGEAIIKYDIICIWFSKINKLLSIILIFKI